MKWMLAALAVCSFGASAVASDKPNFSGQWKVNVAKSDYGQIPPPESFIRKIVHDEPSIEIVEEQTGLGTTPESTRRIKTDGKSLVQQVNGAELTLSATWEGNVLVATTAVESVGVTFKDRMSLSPDGKVLTSVVQIESGQGNTELTIVFDRTP